MVVSGARNTLPDTFRAAGLRADSAGIVNGTPEEINPASSRAPRKGALVGLINAQWTVFPQGALKPSALKDTSSQTARIHSLDLQA